MTDRAFHDAVLRENSIPIEMIRASLTDQPLSPDYTGLEVRWGDPHEKSESSIRAASDNPCVHLLMTASAGSRHPERLSAPSGEPVKSTCRNIFSRFDDDTKRRSARQPPVRELPGDYHADLAQDGPERPRRLGRRPVPGASADAADVPLRIAGQPVEIAVTPIGANRPGQRGPARGWTTSADPGRRLAGPQDRGTPAIRLTTGSPWRRRRPVAADGLGRAAHDPHRGTGWPAHPADPDRRETGAFTFHLGDGPVLGLGEGGPQFDRRGSADRMRSGQGGYRLRTHGGRVPSPG